MEKKLGGDRDGIGLGAFLRLLKAAVRQILDLQNAEAFLSWMRVEAPERFPEIFAGLGYPVRRALATELGRQIWNMTPLPREGYRPMPLPPLRETDRCLCRSGRPYGRCCAGAPAAPGLGPQLLWALAIGELPPQEAAELLENGRIPRPYVGTIARRFLEEGRQVRALALLEPFFNRPEVLDNKDSDEVDALLSSYETLGRKEQIRSFIDDFAERFEQGSGLAPDTPEDDSEADD